jgi:hypothetical protein
MPSNNHEVPLELFRDRPDLAREIARELGLTIPDGLSWRLGPETVTTWNPAELRLDVSLIGSVADRAEFAIINEVQNSCGTGELARIRSSWPEYVTSLRKRLRCPVLLLAFCPDEKIAVKVGEAVETGHPGFVFAPVTYWPGSLPAITDPETARLWPELVLLSVAGQVHHQQWDQALKLVPHAITAFDPDRRVLYYDYVSARLPEAVRRELEEIMTISLDNYQWESEFALRHQALGRAEGKALGRAEGMAVGLAEGSAAGRVEGVAAGRAEGETAGRAQGEAMAILTVLAARGIAVDAATRGYVLGCSDLDQLTRWLKRVAEVSSAAELLDD